MRRIEWAQMTVTQFILANNLEFLNNSTALNSACLQHLKREEHSVQRYDVQLNTKQIPSTLQDEQRFYDIP